MKRQYTISVFLFLLFILMGNAFAGPVEKPGADERCPVCGMYVAKYTNWVAAIVFDDGSKYYFDGTKDMLHFYFDVPRYKKDKTGKNIEAIYVTDYYTTEFIDARKAAFVIGSDVLGPMGHDFVAFSQKEKAEIFLKDHQGKTIVSFDKIDKDLLTGLAKMKHGATMGH